MNLSRSRSSNSDSGVVVERKPQPKWSVVDPRSDPAWATLMAGDSGSLFGSPPWITAIADSYGFDVVADVLFDEDQPIAGLAHAQVTDLRGSRIISLPFCDYLDPVVGSDDEWARLVSPALARGLPLQFRVLNSEAPRRDPHLEAVNELMWHSTDLRRSEEDILADLHAKARQGSRSARRQGVTVTFGSGLDDVRAFHALHRQTRKRKYGLLAQPISFFENIWKQFCPFEGIVVGLAHHDDEVIAGGLYLFWNDVMYYKFGASIAERLSLKPNDLLAWESIRFGSAHSSARYDWGVSDLDQPGLFFFKRKYATEEGKVTVLRHNPTNCDGAETTTGGALLGELTQLFTRADVPDEVTQRAGELLYKYFC